MNDLELAESDVNTQWFTIEELADATGFSVETLKKGDSPLNYLSIDFNVDTRLGGYHNTQKFYSENVLNALKEYQLKNTVQNAVKNNADCITMTTRELANALNVSVDAVTRCANAILDPSAIQRRVINGGNSMVFNQEQATMIKQEIQKHHNLANRTIDKTKTDLEIMQNMMQSFADFKDMCERKEQEYLTLINNQKEQLKEQSPKVEFFDAVADSKDAIDMQKASKVLNMGIGRNTLFDILRKKGVLDRYNIPYQKYINLGYFRTIETRYMVGEEVRVGIKTLVFQKGLNFIKKVVSA